MTFDSNQDNNFILCWSFFFISFHRFWKRCGTCHILGNVSWWNWRSTWQDLPRGLSNDMGSNEQGIPEDKVLNCMIGRVLVVGPKVLLLYSFKTNRILVVREGESEGECVGGTLLLLHFLLFKHFCQILLFIIFLRYFACAAILHNIQLFLLPTTNVTLACFQCPRKYLWRGRKRLPGSDHSCNSGCCRQPSSNPQSDDRPRSWSTTPEYSTV